MEERGLAGGADGIGFVGAHADPVGIGSGPAGPGPANIGNAVAFDPAHAPLSCLDDRLQDGACGANVGEFFGIERACCGNGFEVAVAQAV